MSPSTVPLLRRVQHHVYRSLLRVYRMLPRLARRWLVRLLSPKYTVGAICMIERPDGHILLIRQAYRRNWGFPGGLLKRGEDTGVAARREVLEEVNLPIELIGAPSVVVDAKPQRVDIVYRARPVSLEAVAEVRPASAEILEARWFAPDALPELQHETAEALVALARSSREDISLHPLAGERPSPRSMGQWSRSSLS